jgi:hypothetical protein
MRRIRECDELKLWSAVASGIPRDTAFGAAKKSGVAPGPAEPDSGLATAFGAAKKSGVAPGPAEPDSGLATALQNVSDEP